MKSKDELKKEMNRKFFNIYQYSALFILFPLSYFLWNIALRNNKLVITILTLPILVSYIIPLIGTNITKFWEFNIKHKVGNIRLYHGFVFGSATGIIGFLFYLISPNYAGILNSLIFALVCGSFIGFWNTVYDTNAVKCGFIKINNISSSNGNTPLEVVCDYAPPYFYTFGVIYALFIKLMEYYIINPKEYSLLIVTLFYMAALMLPTLVYMCFHYLKYKSWGLWGQK